MILFEISNYKKRNKIFLFTNNIDPFVLNVTYNGSNKNVADFDSNCAGCNITVACTVSGYANRIPETIWSYENGTRVPEQFINTTGGATFHTSKLVFKEMRREYSGLYKCRVENKIRNIDEILPFRVLIRGMKDGKIRLNLYHFLLMLHAI